MNANEEALIFLCCAYFVCYTSFVGLEIQFMILVNKILRLK
jgi:hypothetical protein